MNLFKDLYLNYKESSKLKKKIKQEKKTLFIKTHLLDLSRNLSNSFSDNNFFYNYLDIHGIINNNILNKYKDRFYNINYRLTWEIILHENSGKHLYTFNWYEIKEMPRLNFSMSSGDSNTF